MFFIKFKFFCIYFNDDFVLFIEFSFKLLLFLIIKLINISINVLRIFLKLFSNNLLININSNNFSRNSFLKFPSCNQFMPRSQRMMFKIISRSISTSNTLNPSSSSLNLSIPTIRSIMCHLIFHMLSKSNMFFHIDTSFF